MRSSLSSKSPAATSSPSTDSTPGVTYDQVKKMYEANRIEVRTLAEVRALVR
jgi:hypothetical protein